MLLVAVFQAINSYLIHSLAKVLNSFVNIYYTHLAFIAINSLMVNFYPQKLNKN